MGFVVRLVARALGVSVAFATSHTGGDLGVGDGLLETRRLTVNLGASVLLLVHLLVLGLVGRAVEEGGLALVLAEGLVRDLAKVNLLLLGGGELPYTRFVALHGLRVRGLGPVDAVFALAAAVSVVLGPLVDILLERGALVLDGLDRSLGDHLTSGLVVLVLSHEGLHELGGLGEAVLVR